MTKRPKSLRLSPVMLCMAATGLAASMSAMAIATLPGIDAAMPCTGLLGVNWTTVPGAVSKLNTAAEVYQDGTAVGTPLDPTKKVFCKVTGYVAPKVRFEVMMPKMGWTQRYHFQGSGGYAGSVSGSGNPLLANANLTNNNAVGFSLATAGELVVATGDLGHARSATEFADGLWAYGDPMALVDFAYTGVHKSVLITKALVNKYYAQDPKYSYYNGCSDGGREGLQEAQRYATEFDGMIIGAPVIDEISTNSQWHAWFWRVNVDASGKNILTQNKIPALAAAVRQVCGVRLNDGTFDTPSDPRTCHFNARSIASSTCDPTTTDACLTYAQADVANKWWSGPIDGYGARLTPSGVPYGSEMYWGVPANANTPVTTLGDYIFSYDFPNWMSAFDAPTGITGVNMKFDRQTFDQMHVLTGMYDPTNPDLRAFKGRGGKMLFWSGSTDSGASPYMVLNYFEALKQFMGQQARDEFAKLFMMPGVGHCGGNKDLYTPLLNWVEQSVVPDVVNVSVNPTTVAGTTFQPRARPVWTHPNVTVYDPATESYTKATSPIISDRFEWVGLRHYTPNHTRWCGQKASGPEQWTLRCEPNP